MKDALTNKPELKDELRALFRKYNDKLSYFEFFQFVQHKMQIKLENWEEDALEGRLDRLGMAFIEFNELNEFSLDFDFKWGEPLLETDLEDILDAKINLSYKDYIVTPEVDFFQGKPTVLTNEKAALHVATKMYKGLKKQKKDLWFDEDFGPRNAEDAKGNAFSLYCTGEPPQKGYTLPEEVEWVYVQELCKPGESPKFLEGSAGPEDCI